MHGEREDKRIEEIKILLRIRNGTEHWTLTIKIVNFVEIARASVT